MGDMAFYHTVVLGCGACAPVPQAECDNRSQAAMQRRLTSSPECAEPCSLELVLSSISVVLPDPRPLRRCITSPLPGRYRYANR